MFSKNLQLPTLILIGLLCASVAVGTNKHLSDLAVLDCDAGLHILPQSPLATTVDLSAVKHLANTYAGDVFETAKTVCPNMGDSEFRRRFLPSVEALLAAVSYPSTFDPKDCVLDSPKAKKLTLFAHSFFEFIGTSSFVKGLCSYADYAKGLPCSYKLSSQDDVDIQLGATVKQCPGSYLPFVSLTCNGAACQSLFLPCDADADCSGGTKCLTLFGDTSLDSILEGMGSILHGMTLIDNVDDHDMNMHWIKLKSYILGMFGSNFGGAASNSASICLVSSSSSFFSSVLQPRTSASEVGKQLHRIHNNHVILILKQSLL
jgi:hypothetical protein